MHSTYHCRYPDCGEQFMSEGGRAGHERSHRMIEIRNVYPDPSGSLEVAQRKFAYARRSR